MNGDEEVSGLGWLLIEGDFLLDVLRRVAAGEDAELVFAEIWANTDDVDFEILP